MQGILDQYGPLIGLISLCLAIVLTAVVVAVALRLRTIARQWNGLMKGAKGDNIESLLLKQIDTAARTDKRLDSAEARLDVAENKIETAKRFVGVVRYDAFEDVGGAQSFAVAVYDDKGDGVVVTSMVGRAECRVYAKEIKKGRADRELSKEEQAAIEAAVKTREAPTEAKAGR